MASSSSSAYDDLRASIADEGIDARVEVNQRALIDKVSFSSPLDRLGDETLSPDHMILRLSHSHRTRTRALSLSLSHTHTHTSSSCAPLVHLIIISIE